MAVSISIYNLLFEYCSLLVFGEQFWALSVYSLSVNKQNIISCFSKSKKDSDSTELLRLYRPQVVFTCAV